MKTLRILVAEDGADLGLLIRKFLERNGHTVQLCENGQKLIDELSANPDQYDLVITDNDMPIMLGIDVLRHIRADDRFKSLPVAVFSGDDDISDEVQKAGGDFFSKRADDAITMLSVAVQNTARRM